MLSKNIKICIWMNIPSHYQSAFFEALMGQKEVDLKVCYLNNMSTARMAEGWAGEYELKSYESCCEGVSSPAEMVSHVPEWESRIHVISSYFSSSLIRFFCDEGVSWCHWSEKPGIRLAEVLGYRMDLFRLLYPVMLGMKRKEGARIKRYACGALAQGQLAERAFKRMGVPGSMIENLYYSPAALAPARACDEIVGFAKGRRVFLFVGALCRRKGIDNLLKAYAGLKTKEWCLVLCGLDRQNGEYKALAGRLGIADRVLFLGAWPSSRIAEVYAAANVFVLSSRFDGWGAVLNEAASVGLPVIGTDLCGASWHVIQPGYNGFRVRAGSSASLMDAMKDYAEHPDLLQAHGEASARLYAESLSPSVNADRFVRALRKWSSREG